MPSIPVPTLPPWLLVSSGAIVTGTAVFALGGRAVLPALLLVAALAVPLVRWRRRIATPAGARPTGKGKEQVLPEVIEELAEVGRWSIELPGGRHRWSPAMAVMLGLDCGTVPTPFLLARILRDGQSQLDIVLAKHRGDTQPFAVEFEALHADGTPRVLRARAQQSLDADSDHGVVLMLVRDVTEDYRRIAQVEDERAAALALAREAQALADTDALTGLANRRQMMRTLDRALLAAKSEGDPLSIVLFDIDHFKGVNDRHGHLMGDKVLRRVGEMALAHSLPDDLLARIGGEEFLWLMPRTNLADARLAAECLRWTIEAGTLSAPFPSVTISAGSATMREGDGSLSLIARADAALYAAKRAGRNQVSEAA